jgi:P27 family predicted phage terminase small subunit
LGKIFGEKIMGKTPDKPALTVDATWTGPRPPRALGEHGLRLWQGVQSEYDISDVAGCEVLAQACAAVDRAETLAEEIARDGQVVRTRTGSLRANPLLAAELAARSLVCSCIEKLGLNLEPIKPMGRPPGPRKPAHAD